MCVKFQLNGIFFKSSAFQHQMNRLTLKILTPPSPLQPLCDKCAPLYHAFTGPFLFAKHPHLMNHSQSHFSGIQIPKTDADTASSTWLYKERPWVQWLKSLLGNTKSRPALILQSAQENITNTLHRSSSNSARPISLDLARPTWLLRNSGGGDCAHHCPLLQV